MHIYSNYLFAQQMNGQSSHVRFFVFEKLENRWHVEQRVTSYGRQFSLIVLREAD